MKPKKINGRWGFDFTYQHKRYRKRGLATKKEADMMIKDILSNPSNSEIKNMNMLFKDYFLDWVDTYKLKKVTYKTYNRYLRAQKDINDYFGENLRLKDLIQSEYQTYLNFLGEHYTKGTIDKKHQPVKASYRQAIYDGLVDKDPTFNAIITSEIEGMPEHVKYMEDYEYEKFLDLLKSDPRRKALLLYILCVTGARFSEVNGLKISNFNFKNETVMIDGTKTDSAKRIVDISSEDAKYIKKKLFEMDTDMSRSLFNYSHSIVYRTFKRLLIKAGIDDKIMHSLRHTHITYLINHGVDVRYVSERVGHASPAITRQFYEHRFKSRDNIESRRTKDVMDNLSVTES